MTADIERLEPERDPVLAAALRDAYGDSSPTPDRRDVLRRRIRQAALALRANPAPAATTIPRQPAPWRAAQPRTGWRRPVWAVPVLLAATVAGILLVHGHERQPTAPPAPPTAAVGFGSAEQALSADVSDAEFARVVTREDDPAALLAIAVQAPTR